MEDALEWLSPYWVILKAHVAASLNKLDNESQRAKEQLWLTGCIKSQTASMYSRDFVLL